MPESCLTPPQVELSLAIVTFSIAYSLCTFLIFCAVHRIAHLSMFSESRKRGLCRQNIKFLWCLFWQHYWCTWGCIHPGNWQARLSFWATACWLRWCIQQFRMQRRPSVPGLWIQKYNGGLDTEESYPYKGVNGLCHFKASNVGVKVLDSVNITLVRRT